MSEKLEAVLYMTENFKIYTNEFSENYWKDMKNMLDGIDKDEVSEAIDSVESYLSLLQEKFNMIQKRLIEYKQSRNVGNSTFSGMDELSRMVAAGVTYDKELIKKALENRPQNYVTLPDYL